MAHMIDFFRSFSGPFSPRRFKKTRSAGDRRLSPNLERLEERTLLSTLLVTNGTATYTASNNIKNNLTIALDGPNYILIDTSETITVAGSGSVGCTGNGTNIVTCPAANITVGIVAFLGDLDDAMQVNSSGVPITANGGSGNDTIVGAPTVRNTLNGDQGSDTLTGGDFAPLGQTADILDGGDGDDAVNAGAGDDNVIGGNGSDTLNGGAGTDWLDYSTSPVGVSVNLTSGKAKGPGDVDPVTGKQRPGNDLVAAFENVRGSNFNDRITGNELANRLEGRGGNDRLNGEGGNDRLLGGDGNDALSGGDGNDLIGEDNDDPLLVTEFEPGNDRMTGGDGDDTMRGGAGNDALAGGNGDDSLRGGAGNDTLSGNFGRDRLFGEDGDDTLIPDPKDRTVNTGPQ